jgi:hypothetical protein
MIPVSKIPCCTPWKCTRCAVVIPAEADYYRLDLGDVAQRVCLGCFVELGGKDGN